jgi:Thioredoxin-related protein
MKKILIIIPFIMLLFGCANNKGYNELTYKQLNEKIENKESFILFIGAKTCSHCELFKETVKEVNDKYKVTINYIDIDKLNSSDLNHLNNIASFSGTPTTIFITKGKEESTYNRISGNRDYDYVVSKLKQNGYIKEVK